MRSIHQYQLNTTMDVIRCSLFLYLIYLCESATINNKNDTLKLFEDDISSVGNSIATFTFDVIRKIFNEVQQTGEDYETSSAQNENYETSVSSPRKIRSARDNSLELCQQRCKEMYFQDQQLETQQIKDLKLEVEKLQELVKLLREQQKVINILEQNATKMHKTRQDDNAPNSEQLALIKQDLKEIVASLNQTKEFINIQKMKDEIIENELVKQQHEITKLQSVVDKMVKGNASDDGPKLGSRQAARASEMSDLKKLLKSLPGDDDDDDEQLRAKLVQLQKQMQKRKKDKELKALEKSLDQDSDSEFLKQLIKALRKQPESKNDDVTNLDDLQDAINGLRPKQDDLQFQAMLNKLINRPSNANRPQEISITPEQMVDLTKKMTQNNVQYICIPDDGTYRMTVPRSYQYNPPPDYSPQQFFPGPAAQPNYYPPPNVNAASQDKPPSYQAETASTYQTDLKQQINGIQAAIDNLHRPEYTQNADDKSAVEDLERQITDLRSIVDNLNYENSYRSSRPKRAVDNDDTKLVQGVTNFVDQLLDQQPEKPHVTAIQQKINALKNQLGPTNNKIRASYQQPYNNYPPNDYNEVEVVPIKKHVKSAKNILLQELVSIILDKVVSVIPVVVQKLFNFSIEDVHNEEDYELQTVLKNLGLFGFLPIAFLKFHRGALAFANILRKDNYFRDFVVPAIVLGVVGGAVLFLIWWLKPEDNCQVQYPNNYQHYPPHGDNYKQNNYNQYPNNNNYKQHHNNYKQNHNNYKQYPNNNYNQYPDNNQYPVSNYPEGQMYSRGYINK